MTGLTEQRVYSEFCVGTSGWPCVKARQRFGQNTGNSHKLAKYPCRQTTRESVWDVSRDARVRNSLTVLQVGQAEEEAVILQAIVVHLHLKQPRLHILPLKILAGSRSPSALTRCRNSASAMSGTSMPATATYRRLAELPHLPRSDQPRRSNDQHDRPIRRIPRVEQDKGPASVRELGRVGPPSVTPLEMMVSVSAGSAERSD
jgi:hypothetical protein